MLTFVITYSILISTDRTIPQNENQMNGKSLLSLKFRFDRKFRTLTLYDFFESS